MHDQDFIPCTGFETTAIDGLSVGECSVIKSYIPPEEPQCPDDVIPGIEGAWTLIPHQGSFPQADHGWEICKYDSTSTMGHETDHWLTCNVVYLKNSSRPCGEEPRQGRTCP